MYNIRTACRIEHWNNKQSFHYKELWQGTPIFLTPGFCPIWQLHKFSLSMRPVLIMFSFIPEFDFQKFIRNSILKNAWNQNAYTHA